ncbi:protein unc-93 homolog A-like [Rhinoderma darwinii]|uniref:protein unc-93 homolog A-like n=1 Tax=Rhinoderma darwinii TaxID=43563 RepID=UPI003F6644E9
MKLALYNQLQGRKKINMELGHLKNIFVISVGFLLIFVAFGGLQTLQSSLNPSGGLGAVSLSVTYGGQIFSAAVFTPFVISKFGCKRTLTIFTCSYIIYTLANFYPRWYTLIPASVILGLGASPFWTAKCTYLTVSARRHALKSGNKDMHVINQYFGIFFLVFQSSRVWGNLISSLVLNLAQPNDETIWNNTDCGANEAFLLLTGNLSEIAGNLSEQSGNWSQTCRPSQPSNVLVYIILGVYVACGLFSLLLITVFLDPIDHTIENTNGGCHENVWAPFLATVKHLQDKRQCLLIPLTVYSGMVQGFIFSDYTKSYVTCSLGMQYVGYVIIVYGATTSIFSYIFGKLSQYIKRISFFTSAMVINISSIAALFVWKPHRHQLGVFFLFSGLWGIADAVWQTLLNGFYGILFEENREAAFASYLLWKSLGYVLSFGYSSFLGVYVKLCILLATLLFGMLLYLIVEYIEFKKTQIQVHSFMDIEALSEKGSETRDLRCFLRTFRTVFEEPGRVFLATASLLTVPQRHTSVGGYASQFRTVAAELIWNNEALVATFWQFLFSNIKDELAARDLPSTLNKLILLATRSDMRIQEWSQEIHRVRRLPRLAPTLQQPLLPSSASPPEEPTQMDNLKFSIQEK